MLTIVIIMIILPGNSLFGLNDLVAVITGGSRGLGAEMSRAFAQAGATVVIASRNLEHCQVLADELRETTGRQALAYGLHVGHWDEAEPFVNTVYDRLGHIDVLVNNAGMSPLYDSLPNVTEALFDKVIDVNLKGAFRLTALIGPRMAADRGGSIINVSSVGAVHPRPEILPYAAAKAGLNALTAGFARAFGPAVRCNAIMAGTFLTDIAKSWEPEAFAERASAFALKRAGNPAEIVGTALYLASSASSYTTGAIITVDGGQ